MTHVVIPIVWHIGGTSQGEASEAVSQLLAAGGKAFGSFVQLDTITTLWAVPRQAAPAGLVALDAALLTDEVG